MEVEKDITAKISQHISSKGYMWTDPREFAFPQSSDGSIGVVIDGKGFSQCADIEDVLETLINMNYISELTKLRTSENRKQEMKLEDRITNIRLIQMNLEHDLDALTSVILDSLAEESHTVLDLRSNITTDNITKILSHADSRLDKDTELVIKSKLRNRVEKYIESMSIQH
ncbi:hypothetical protein HCB69_15935 [Listeria booriae]|uniref:Uncharacterized protein n=1 Tax=Listeria booriae TaxID=1552123 RepID=A0A842G6X0_9LIST|nr:hypothetical protein [Listeria booriae]MBC2285866.1 hypothetical protein [Listeria booriae]